MNTIETISLMTREEALESVRQIRENLENTRFLLLEIHDRKGYRSLGYKTFAEFGEKEFGYQRSYMHLLITALKTAVKYELPIDMKPAFLAEIAKAPDEIAEQVVPLIREAYIRNETKAAPVMLDGQKITGHKIRELLHHASVDTHYVQRFPYACLHSDSETDGFIIRFRLPTGRLGEVLVPISEVQV